MVETKTADIPPSSPARAAPTPLSLKHGLDVRVIEIAQGSTLQTLVDIVARERGVRVEELEVFRDGVEEAIAISIVIDAHYPHHDRHHVHHKAPVEVAVHYNGGTKAKAFPRRTTIDKVLEFSIGAFGLDSTMATEFELARAGIHEELLSTEHIGHLASHHRLELDLVRGDIANG